MCTPRPKKRGAKLTKVINKRSIHLLVLAKFARHLPRQALLKTYSYVRSGF